MQTERQVAANPQTKPIDLGRESAGSCYHPHPPSPFYCYSAQRLILILPFHVWRRLSCRRMFSTKKG